MKCRRYYEIGTSAFLIAAITGSISIYSFLKGKSNRNEYLILTLIFLLAAIVFVMEYIKVSKAPGRLHASERKDIKIKPEEGCFEDWDGKAPVDIDGVCIDGKKYKVMNGVDVKITKDGKIKYCSALAGFLNEMWQKEEREAMETSDCWKC